MRTVSDKGAGTQAAVEGSTAGEVVGTQAEAQTGRLGVGGQFGTPVAAVGE